MKLASFFEEKMDANEEHVGLHVRFFDRDSGRFVWSPNI